MDARAERSPERLVFFSDAVVAIAVTLLILPLADAVPEAVAKHTPSLELISENGWKIFSFLLSFAVILRLWAVHHRFFEQVRAMSQGLMVANFGWLLAIVVLPFPTEMVAGYSDDRFTRSFYIGTMLAASACQLAMVLITRHSPGIAKDDAPDLDRMSFGSLASVTAILIAFVLGTLVPGVSYYPLLLLPLTGPLERLREHRLAARA